MTPEEIAGKIRQLTPEDLRRIQDNATISGDTLILSQGDVLSLLNEISYHRTRKEGYCTIESLVSMRDQKPYVRISIGGAEMQLSLADAYEHAHKIVQVAAGAAADAFLYNFMVEQIGMPKEKLGPLMTAFRTYRESTLDEPPFRPPERTPLSPDIDGEKQN